MVKLMMTADSSLNKHRYFDIPMKNLQVVFPVQKTMWNLADVVSFLMLLSFSITLAFKAFFAIANSTCGQLGNSSSANRLPLVE